MTETRMEQFQRELKEYNQLKQRVTAIKRAKRKQSKKARKLNR